MQMKLLNEESQMDPSDEFKQCPKCGSDNLYKFIPELELNLLKVSFSCNNCKILGDAIFKVKFSHFEDSDGTLTK